MVVSSDQFILRHHIIIYFAGFGLATAKGCLENEYEDDDDNRRIF